MVTRATVTREAEAPPAGRRGKGYVGQSVRRKEDRRLVTGRGRYVGDLRLDGMLEAAVVRSPVARARVLSIDTEAALACEGVVAVITAADLAGRVDPFTRFVDQEDTPPGLEEAVHPVVLPCPMEPLASSEVRYVGQPVAVVVARSRYAAEDGAEAVSIDYDELPAIVDVDRAARDSDDQVHAGLGTNVQASFGVNVGDVDAALARAPHTLTRRFHVPRLAANPLEARGIVAAHDPATGVLTVWSSTQVPHMVRTRIEEQLHLPVDSVRIIAPDMGGGFGPKVNVYQEELIIPYLAIALRAPVRWIEDRQEHLQATMHARDQVHEVTVGYTDDGQVLAIKDTFLLDCGAYNPFSLTCAYNTAAHLRGPYKVPDYSIQGLCVLTNKCPNGPYRGAGRPEAVFVMDRVLSIVAGATGLDPAEVCRRNLIGPEEMPYDQGMPYRDGVRIAYENGDYPGALDRALELAGYDSHRASQASLAAEGRHVGVGMSFYIEGTGIGPMEGCSVRLNSSGEIVVHSGSAPHGQSHETTLAQICADELDVPLSGVNIRAGDTSLIPFGTGTFASRSLVTAGSAVALAARRVRRHILAVAAEVLGVPAPDLVIEDGKVHPAGAPDKSVTLAEVARAAAPGPRGIVPPGYGPGIAATSYFVPSTVTFAFGVHVAVVEVDPELGEVSILRYVVVHDAGRLVNPLVVEGQIQGGVAQGIGSALYEEMIYDPAGQPLTTTFMDYLLPGTGEVPTVIQAHVEDPSPRNPLGVKGVGEGGAISPPAAIANAVVDALGGGVEVADLPLTPERVRSLVEAAGLGGAPERG